MAVPALSAIEEEVVQLVAGGRTTAEAAAALRLSVPTVEWHLARASLKLERAAALHGRVRQAEPMAAQEEGSR